MRDYPEFCTVPEVPQPPPQTWPESLTAVIGKRVAHYRKARKLSAQRLSDQLRDRLGVDMKRSVLGDLENGVRKAVNVSEILAIAYVLGVPPLLLVAPVGEVEDVEALPGISVDPWSLARWVGGEGGHQLLDADAPGFEQLSGFLRLYRWHDQLLNEWDGARHVTVGRLPEDDRLALARIRSITDQITIARNMIRQQGGQPPPLPEQLHYLDQQKGGKDAGDQEDHPDQR